MRLKMKRKQKRSRTSVRSLQSTSSHSSIDYKMSAAYVSDAIEGRFYKAGLGTNLEEHRHASLWCLRITSHFTYTILLFLVVGFHCSLSAVEPSQMIVRSGTLGTLAFWGGISCCIFYIIDIILVISYCRPKLYFAFTHGRLYILIFFLISSDYILYLACCRMIFRLLRPLLLLFRVPALRNTGLVMMGVTPKFLQFLLFMGGFVIVFAVIGVHLFMNTYIDSDVVERQHDGIYVGAFNHTGIAILQVFVLMAGGSYPRFMFPAYDEIGSSVLPFFIIIIMTGEIILYGILVAKIYDVYVQANKDHVKQERYHERQCLIKAFEILDQSNAGVVSFAHWKGLIKALKPKATSSEILKRFRKLKDLSKKALPDDVEDRDDESNSDYLTINLYEFFHLPNVLQFTVEKSNIKRNFEVNFRNRNNFEIWLQRIGEKLAWICRKYCNNKWSYYFSVTLNIVFLLPFTFVWYGLDAEITRIMLTIELVLLLVITLELLVQFIALGYAYMVRDMLLHVTMVAIAMGCIIYTRVANVDHWNEGWIPVIAYLAMMIRLLGFKRKSSSTFHWLRRIAPPFFTLLCLTVIAFYTYGILGMECFSYLANESNKHKSLPEGISLCEYGFEHLGCSFLTLFQISLGSSWHKVMQFIMEEVSDWSALYFVFFYAFMQMLVLNIISAIIVELSNAIYNDENEAKQRDKDTGTREETNIFKQDSNARSTDIFSKGSSTSNASVMAAITATTSIITSDSPALFSIKYDETTFSQNLPSRNYEPLSSRRESNDSLETVGPRQMSLPCTINEDLELEDVGEVTLTGRKELGKWTRDILPDMTFLNPDELKRLYADMGKSVQRARVEKFSKRRAPFSTA